VTVGMFTYDKKARVFWFSTVPCENYQEFNLVGVVSFLAATCSTHSCYSLDESVSAIPMTVLLEWDLLR